MPARVGPGPGTYGLPTTVGYKGHDVTKRRNPAYTMRPQLDDGKKSIGPGPKYMFKQNITNYGPGGIPSYSFGQRTQLIDKHFAPGPGTYAPEKCPPIRTKPPAYTMSPRTEPIWHPIGPGPAYKLPTYIGPKNPDKHANPAYTMGGRLEPLRAGVSPGPAQYGSPDMDRVKQKKPVYTMATRNFPPLAKPTGPGPAGYYPRKVTCDKNPGYSFGVRHCEYEVPLILKEDN